ncbi:ABC transporter [Longispora fulva]|uniref:ABC transporter permease n=1 Tax=Longispora fulva TaxID=619741 RepID=A0A8J7GG79_9ACTN|nr:hypothetical protein [Longispora fulva]MBG6136087.1 hypothetical protein [Longispora fulva]GIG55668.1 ABC transporter [Longispora fulva]
MSLGAACRAEWTKVRTVWSTPVALGIAVALSAGLGGLVGLAMHRPLPAAQEAKFDLLFPAWYGLTLAQLALVVFAVLQLTGEYSTGTIWPSLAAVPNRATFHLAKTLTVLAVSGAASAAMVTAAFVGARVGLRPRVLDPGGPGVLESAVGAWLYLELMAAFALGVASVLRRPVPTLAVLLPTLFLGAQGLGGIPKLGAVTQYLPDQLGWVMLHLAGPQDDPRWARDYGAWTGLALLAGWVLVTHLAGYLLLRHRDPG